MILSEEKREILKDDANLLLQEVETLMVKLQFEECLQKLQVLMNDYELLGEYDLLLKCHVNSAICHYNLGNIKMAFSLVNNYEQMCAEYNRPISKVDYYPLLGLQYMYKGDFEKSIHYYELAAASALNEHQYRLFVTSKKHITHVATQIGNYRLALQAVEEAKQLLPKLNKDDINQIELLLVQIKLYLEMDKTEDAYASILQAEKHPMLKLDDVTYALYCEFYANYLIKIKDFFGAYEYANKGLSLLQGTAQFVSEHDLYELLIKICTYIDDKTYLIGVYERYVESLKQTRDQSFSSELVKRDFEDLKKLTEIDNLTGVYNRKYLIERTSEWLNVAPMNNDSVICGVFDVDHFKQINDRFGHLTGDQLLKELSAKCNDLLSSDSMFLARYGGDEFVIIHRCVDVAKGLSKVEGIYNQLKELIIDLNGQKFDLSISMGISYTELGEFVLFEQLFEKSDEALYRSKQDGRKLLTIY
jgi:diguanylate cyclase (GGDEF)-like protein